jgi:uncharacterized tellurite resistance protein B-like protein
MFILFGWRGVTTTPARGSFFCPRCRKSQPYVHKRVRRFFTLFFIPVIPLEMLGEFVECLHCHGTFEMRVIGTSFQQSMIQEAEQTALFQAKLKVAVAHLMFMTALSDGQMDEQEEAAIGQVYIDWYGVRPTPEELRATLDEYRRTNPPVLAELEEIAGSLSDNGRAQVVKAAFSVATARGNPLSAEQKEIIEKASAALSAGQLKKMTESLLQGAAGPAALPANGENGIRPVPEVSSALAELQAAVRQVQS